MIAKLNILYYAIKTDRAALNENSIMIDRKGISLFNITNLRLNKIIYLLSIIVL